MKHLLFIIPFLSFANQDFFCSCVYQKLDKHIKDTNAILIGDVISSKEVTGRMYIRYEYIVKVKHYYKARQVEKVVKVVSGAGGGDCGYPFRVGKRYIIFGSTSSLTKGSTLPANTFYTSICDATSPFDAEMQQKLDKRLVRKHP
ncbi:hypothetical protein BKI52_36250 [marine bacterium AO1-C]|nr:hypothetical protein BKI52_36250 [marine bacterium AO1-C]